MISNNIVFKKEEIIPFILNVSKTLDAQAIFIFSKTNQSFWTSNTPILHSNSIRNGNESIQRPMLGPFHSNL